MNLPVFDARLVPVEVEAEETNVLLKMIGRMELAAKAKTEKQAAEALQDAIPAAGKRSGQGQFPFFLDDDTAALPNHLARTPLFSPVPWVQPGPPIKAGRWERHERIRHLRVKLASPEGVAMWYTGEQLDMTDQDVFMLALKFAQSIDLGTPVRRNRSEFLKAFGWKPSSKRGSFGTSAYQWLDESFDRLTSAKLSTTTKRWTSHLVLVSSWIQDDQTREWEFTLDRKILQPFQNDEFSFVDLEKRGKIAKRVHMAKWLQSYAVSHQRGLHRVGLANLKEWCGYRSPMRKFRETLREALDELSRVDVLVNIEFYKNETMVKWMRS